MRRETTEALRKLEETGYDHEAAIARMRETAPDGPMADVVPIQTSLPSRHDEPRVSMDMVELHDLVYAAALSYLDGFDSMRQGKKLEHARGIAQRAELHAWASDHLERGDRP